MVNWLPLFPVTAADCRWLYRECSHSFVSDCQAPEIKHAWSARCTTTPRFVLCCHKYIVIVIFTEGHVCFFVFFWFLSLIYFFFFLPAYFMILWQVRLIKFTVCITLTEGRLLKTIRCWIIITEGYKLRYRVGCRLHFRKVLEHVDSRIWQWWTSTI